jgi:AraC family transcriptional regulator
MDVTKPPSNIPILRATNGEILPGNPFSGAVLSSACSNWHNLLVEEHRVPSNELDDAMFIQHVVSVNVGRRVTLEITKEGRSCVLETGAVSLFPSHQSFFSRRKKEESWSAHVILVALDPVFVSQTATELEVDPDHVELVEQRTGNDPTLRHIAMALHAGLQAGRTSDPAYAEGLSISLAVHLLREYGCFAVSPKHAHCGLSREKLTRAIEYIQDQLTANVTVSGIARAVHMSPYHFTRLFKQSTGLSPHRYVIQARTKKAKELLTSDKFSIVEVAHRVGFADQSHLTRHLKNAFGVTPKMLQRGRYPEQYPPKRRQEYPRERPA